MSFRPLVYLSLFITPLAWADRLVFDLEEATRYALKHQPSLAAARLQVEEARGRLLQSGRLSNPDLELDFARKTRGQEGSAGVGLTQRFPLTARLRHEKAVTRAELAAAEAEVHEAERKLVADVRTAGVKLLALAGQRRLREQQTSQRRQLSDFLQKRVAAGEASALDAAQVDLETRQIEAENLSQSAEEATLLGELRGLLGLRSSAPIALTGELPSAQSLPPPRTILHRPDIVAAEARAEASRSAVLEQRARRWDDIGLGASYTRERSLDEPGPIETEHVIGLRVTLPLPLWNDNSGRIREAEAAAARAEREVEAARLTADAEVAAALGAMRAYANLVEELDRKVLPVASQLEQQLRQSYSTGQTPLTEVLRAGTRRLELERQRLDALRDYHLARVRYLAASVESASATPAKKK